MAYRLTLTEQDMKTVDFVGERYNWSEALQGIYRRCETTTGHDGDTYLIPEHEAWVLRDAFDADTEGGHCMFPMLDGSSDLARKLWKFWESIV